MVTLKLNNEPYWICGAMIFSGLRDPSWLLSEDETQKILSIWNSLPVSSKNVFIPNILGYKGCFLSSSDKNKWAAFREVVTLLKENTVIESRIDTDRKFEKAVLDTAPEEAIPKAVLIEEFK